MSWPVPVALGVLGLLILSEGGGVPLAADPFGAAVVEAARRSLGVRETAPNSGPEIDAWIREIGLTPPAQWCAAAVSHWLREASKATGRPSPIAGAGSAKALYRQFQLAGRALTAEQCRARALPPGAVLIWDRSEPPNSGPQGHTGIVERDAGDAWTTIEGNTASNDVRRVTRAKAEPRLLGAGLVGAAASAAPPQFPPPQQQQPSAPSASRDPLVIGDSIGVGLAGPLGAALGVPVLNRAEVSTTIDNWADPLVGDFAASERLRDAAFAAGAPIVTFISLGTNDIASKASAEPKRAKVRAIIAAIRASGGRPAWIMPPQLPWPGEGVRAVLAQELTAAGVAVFDARDVEFERAPDKVHATPAGYKALAAAIAAWAKASKLLVS